MFLQNIYNDLHSDFIDWKQTKIDQISSWIEHDWQHYKKERGALAGLAFSTICSIAAAILIAHPTPILAGGIFGVIHYTLLTPITEELLQREGFHKSIYPLLTIGSGIVGRLFLQTICKIHLSIPGTLFLTAAAFLGGQAVRLTVYGDPD